MWCPCGAVSCLQLRLVFCGLTLAAGLLSISLLQASRKLNSIVFIVSPVLLSHNWMIRIIQNTFHSAPGQPIEWIIKPIGAGLIEDWRRRKQAWIDAVTIDDRENAPDSGASPPQNGQLIPGS